MIYLASRAPQKYAGLINDFNRDYLNPYLNFHRPCFVPEVIVDAKGKQRKRHLYQRMMTDYEKLKSLPKAERSSSLTYLRTPECTGYSALDFLRMGRHDHSLRNHWGRTASK